MSHNCCSSCHSRQCTGEYCAKKVMLFDELDDQLLQKLMSDVDRKRYEKGEVIFETGQVSDRLYIVNAGRMKIYNYTREGKEQIIYILSEGDFIGEMSLLKRTSFDFNAAALEDTHLCTISKQHFDGILKENPSIALKILEALHDKIIKLEQLVQNLSTKDIEARIASMLLGFIKESGTAPKDGMLLELPLNREEMGSFIGTTRETISRKLTSMQDDGIIAFEGNKKVIIKNISVLEDMI